MSTDFSEELKKLTAQLSSIEPELKSDLKLLDTNGNKWFNLDKKRDEILSSVGEDHVLLLNIGGTKFQTSLRTIFNIKDNLFYNLIVEKDLDYNKEIFIDRSGSLFPYILSYMRNKSIKLDTLKQWELEDLYRECLFYEVRGLEQILREAKEQVYFVSFEFSGAHLNGGNAVGTNQISDINNINDRTMMKGICARSPGWIVFQLNRQTEFEELEVGAWRGNTTTWAPSNGSNAKILVSMDKISWVDTGAIIPASFANGIVKVSVKRSKAKFIKINHTSYLGLGYFRITK